MDRSPDSLIPPAEGQPSTGKRDDKALICRQEGEANSRAATQVNAVSASSTSPTSRPTQLELFPGRARPPTAKPATGHGTTINSVACRDGVEGGGTRRKQARITGETLFGPPAETSLSLSGRKAHKGTTRKCGSEAEQGGGGGRSTEELRDKRREGRAATSIVRPKQGKAAGLPPKGKAPSRRSPRRPQRPARMDNARKLQRTLYRVAKKQPQRRFNLLYDKVCRPDILLEAWRRVKSNRGAAGVDGEGMEEVDRYGPERFLAELRESLMAGTYRVQPVRRVHIPKPGQPGRTRPLGIPVVRDRVVQMAVKMVIEPLFETDFLPCSYGFRPQRTPRMALSEIVRSVNAGYGHVVDVDLKSYFDTIDHGILLKFVDRRVGDVRVLRLIRAWLKAGIMEEGKITHPMRGSPQGGVISPLLSNIMLHEVDRQWGGTVEGSASRVRLIRYADDMVLLARNPGEAQQAWTSLQSQLSRLLLSVNQDKSRVTTVEKGFAFLGFEFCRRQGQVYLWPRSKACQHVAERVRQTTRSIPSSQGLDVVIRKLHPILNGWCTYFRAGHSNRVFHKVDWDVRSEVQFWLRRKYQCSWRTAKRRWGYSFLHDTCRLYRMVGKVSHLEGLRRTPPEENGRRAGCGKTARPVR